MHDITNYISWFVSQFFDLLESCIDIISSFEFYGFTLFEFELSLILATLFITVFIPIIHTSKKNELKAHERRHK